LKTTENFDKFLNEYKKQLLLAVKNRPTEYGYPVSQVPTVVAKMEQAFIKGTYNKDGYAIKATCKALNIGYTYRDINNFLGHNEL